MFVSTLRTPLTYKSHYPRSHSQALLYFKASDDESAIVFGVKDKFLGISPEERRRIEAAKEEVRAWMAADEHLPDTEPELDPAALEIAVGTYLAVHDVPLDRAGVVIEEVLSPETPPLPDSPPDA